MLQDGHSLLLFSLDDSPRELVEEILCRYSREVYQTSIGEAVNKSIPLFMIRLTGGTNNIFLDAYIPAYASASGDHWLSWGARRFVASTTYKLIPCWPSQSMCCEF